jgi:hypothetical protein
MQDRLLASIAGAMVGIVLDTYVSSRMDLNPFHTLLLCSFGGMALGYMISSLVDVFSASTAPDRK